MASAGSLNVKVKGGVINNVSSNVNMNGSKVKLVSDCLKEHLSTSFAKSSVVKLWHGKEESSPGFNLDSAIFGCDD